MLKHTATDAAARVQRFHIQLSKFAARSASEKASVARTVAEHYRHVIRLASLETRPIVKPMEVHKSPLISLITPVYETYPDHLDALLQSFSKQTNSNTELVLCDDGSRSLATRQCLRRWNGYPGLTIVRLESNSGIAAATNRALTEARGKWVGFVDHDDVLSPHALERLDRTLKTHPDAEFIYTDEVVADERLRPVGYILKPAFDPVLLSGVNYINHLSLFRRERLMQLGGLSRGFDGSQDYELLLRYLSGIAPKAVVHLPFPAYIWRRAEGTFSVRNKQRAIDAARRALARHHSSARGELSVHPAIDPDLHRPRFDLAMESWPLVSIVIPTRDAFDLISRVLKDLSENTDYPSLEIIVVDNGSSDLRVLELYERCKRHIPDFKSVLEVEPFNFARQVNKGIGLASGKYVLLLNNDVQILSSDWLREMVSCFSYERVGIVGARLLYPNKTIQHAGVIVGFGGLAAHWFDGSPADHPGPFSRLRVRQTMSAVTGACMLISRECLDRVGHFDEANFAIAYNDIDYCLRAAEHGFSTVWTPFASLIHHQSASRGSDDTAANWNRFQREKTALQGRYGTADYVDPYSSPWYTRRLAVPGLAMLPALPEARRGR
jgi:GT2 family glycosyltransferase